MKPLALAVLLTLAACGWRSELDPASSSTPNNGGAGAGGGGGASGCAQGTHENPEAEIGTGADAFEPIREDGRIRLTWGNQGGAHLWSSARVWGVDSGTTTGVINEQSPLVEFRIETGGNLLNYKYSERHNLVVRPEGSAELIGEVVQLLNPTVADGIAATFSVQLEDACGVRVAHSRDITIIDGPLD